MKLDDVQTARVREWIDQGLKVSEIQTRLADELGVKLTYMEARFLLDDLKLRPKDLAPTAVPTPMIGGATPGAGPVAGARAPGPGSLPPVPPSLRAAPMTEPSPAAGRVKVTVDEIARPTMVVSGKVTFSDGQVAEWGIDQTGRPMLMPTQKGYRPAQADVVDFQEELGQVLARLGY